MVDVAPGIAVKVMLSVDDCHWNVMPVAPLVYPERVSVAEELLQTACVAGVMVPGVGIPLHNGLPEVLVTKAQHVFKTIHHVRR